jgi:hypothetical protein
MKRNALSEKYSRSNIRSKLFHECIFCHDSGLKSRVLETKHGDYGLRDDLKNEKTLELDSDGLCQACQKLIRAKNL